MTTNYEEAVFRKRTASALSTHRRWAREDRLELDYDLEALRDTVRPTWSLAVVPTAATPSPYATSAWTTTGRGRAAVCTPCTALSAAAGATTR
jgi:hypothetical protein